MREALRSRRDFDAFNAYLRSENGSQVDEWQKALEDWSEDHSRPDPFRASITGMLFTVYICLRAHISIDNASSLAQVRLDLALEFKASVDEGHGRTYEVNPTSFLLLGMNIQGML